MAKEKKPKLTKEEKQAQKEEAKAAKERAKEEQKEAREREKEEKRLAKLEAKAKKRGKKFDPNDPEWEDEEGGSLLIAMVAFMIILVWLGIVAALVKLDVGGVGSTMLYPILKDVPVINRILPGIEGELEKQAAENKKRAEERARQKAVEKAKKAALEAQDEAKKPSEEENVGGYTSLSEAVAEIDRLKQQLDKEKKTRNSRTAEIADLKAQVEQLQSYKDNVDEFEKEKEKFYNEVVFSDEAPDINTYKEYYESIEPENAEQIYKQIVEQKQSDNDIKSFATTYSTMDSSEAAAIFDTMSNNLKLVSKILGAMSVEDRSAILAAMEKENAARLTELMEP